MPGKRAGKSATCAGVEPGAARRVGRGHGPGHDVAGRQLAPRIGLQREPPAFPVHQPGARRREPPRR